jgi:CelD/BcsL family acetyltransferase involved in cellulose biosynthesis
MSRPTSIDPAAAPTATERLSFEEFCGLEREWDDLVGRTRRPCIFSSHDWVRLWWRHFGEDREFLALLVRGRGGELLAAVPLTIRSLRVPHRLRVVEIAGTGPVPTRGMGLADRADLLVRADAPQALDALIAGVCRLLEHCDVLHVKGLEADSPACAGLIEHAPRPRAARVLDRSQSPYLALTSSWEGYLRGRSQKFRKNLKRSRRLLEDGGPIRISRLATGDDPGPWIAQVTAINERSWSASRGTNLFLHPRLRSFLTEIVSHMARRGWIELHVLHVGDRSVAYELCFDFGGCVLAYNASYDQELARASPGMLVTASIIESSCARGRTEYDMLRGDESYKLRWSETVRSEIQVVVPADRVAARAGARWAIELTERMRGWAWLRDVDDRMSGLLNRVRFRRGAT